MMPRHLLFIAMRLYSPYLRMTRQAVETVAKQHAPDPARGDLDPMIAMKCPEQ
jgi:hypothetical protein